MISNVYYKMSEVIKKYQRISANNNKASHETNIINKRSNHTYVESKYSKKEVDNKKYINTTLNEKPKEIDIKQNKEKPNYYSIKPTLNASNIIIHSICKNQKQKKIKQIRENMNLK